MLSYLAAHGITAERKSVYDDLELLSLYGMDVQSVLLVRLLLQKAGQVQQLQLLVGHVAPPFGSVRRL